MPLVLVAVVLSHQALSSIAPARSMCLAIEKSKFCATVKSRPSRTPDCPAPPDVNASRTRIVGAVEDEVSVCLRLRQLDAEFAEQLLADGPGVAHAQRVVGGLVLVGALGEIEVADAEIAAGAVAARVLAHAGCWSG